MGLIGTGMVSIFFVLAFFGPSGLIRWWDGLFKRWLFIWEKISQFIA